LLVEKYKVILKPSYRAESEEAKETLKNLKNERIYKFDQNYILAK